MSRLRVGDRVLYPGDENEDPGEVVASYRWRTGGGRGRQHEELAVKWPDGEVDQVSRSGWGRVGVPRDVRVVRCA